MRFCFIILCHLYLLSSLGYLLVGSFTQNAFSIPLRYFPLYFKVNALRMSLNLNAALSSFIAASPRLIHHSKTLHWKKKKKEIKTSSTDLSRDQNTICVWMQYSNSCSSSAGRLVYGPTNTWMGHMFLFIYLFLLCATSSPPFVTSVAPSSVLLWRRLCMYLLYMFTSRRAFSHVSVCMKSKVTVTSPYQPVALYAM